MGRSIAQTPRPSPSRARATDWPTTRGGSVSVVYLHPKVSTSSRSQRSAATAGRPHVRGIVENVRGAAERKDATRRESVEKARRMANERPPTRLCNTMRRLSDKGELTLDRSNPPAGARVSLAFDRLSTFSTRATLRVKPCLLASVLQAAS